MMCSTPEDAFDAIAADPRGGVNDNLLERFAGDELALGHMYRLAGKDKEAEHHLRRALSMCDFEEELTRLHAKAELATLLDKDTPSSEGCQLWKEIVDRWGSQTQSKTVTAAHGELRRCRDINALYQ